MPGRWGLTPYDWSIAAESTPKAAREQGFPASQTQGHSSPRRSVWGAKTLLTPRDHRDLQVKPSGEASRG
jgi:hypothetical protein